MRVLHVIPYSSSLYGGPPVVVDQMASCSVKLGVLMDVVSTTANGEMELDVCSGQTFVNGARHFRFLRQGPKSWMFSLPLGQWLFLHIPDYDLVHVHGLFSYTTLVACAVARNFKKPYLISTHGMIDPWCLSHKSWKKRPYFNLFERFNLQRAASIHVTSSMEAMSVAELGFFSEIAVIPLSVSFPSQRNRLYFEKQSLSLLFLSRLDPIKGLPLLFRALALFRNRSTIKITLRIVGQGTAEYTFALEAMVRDLGLIGIVEFLGFQSGEMKTRLLEEADVFILPSHHENFSLATAEAMAAGLPVIVSDRVGISQEVREASAGIVVRDNSPADIADAIEIVSSARFRRVTGENARKLVKEKFSEDKFGRSLQHLYQRVFSRTS